MFRDKFMKLVEARNKVLTDDEIDSTITPSSPLKNHLQDEHIKYNNTK